ncbi:exopolysaccharide production repressor protein [Mesorhizobium sp. Cs1299R1N3]|uniref:exopolysaccharide production repressor protein n=2 Tax=unclassified Mesorhizobium TaxID=325217 RepID=UPI00301BEE07
MPLRMFCHVLAVVLPVNALGAYLLSHSIRAAILKTLSCALLLQAGYFGSVLFLIWRSGCAARKTELFDGDEEVRRQSQTCREDEE